jgi:hypothetical protein
LYSLKKIKVFDLSDFSLKFLAKANRSGFEDMLLGKVKIPKSDEEIDEKEIILVNNADLNEINYTELILLIDIS